MTQRFEPTKALDADDCLSRRFTIALSGVKLSGMCTVFEGRGGVIDEDVLTIVLDDDGWGRVEIRAAAARWEPEAS